jgi:hypothetical protein
MNQDFPNDPGPQPDPMLKDGRANSVWVWLIGVVVAGVVVAVLVAISPTSPPNGASMSNQPGLAGSNSQNGPNAQSPGGLAGGRGASGAPDASSTTGSGNSTR